MGICSSQQRDEDSIDYQKDQVITDGTRYRPKPLANSNANYLDSRLASVGDTFMTSSNPHAANVVNNVYQPQPLESTAVVYQNMDQSEQMLSTDNVNQDNRQRPSVRAPILDTADNPTGIGAAHVGNYTNQPVQKVIEDGYHSKHTQGSDDYQQGSAPMITTNNDHQNSGNQQVAASGSTNNVFEGPIDEQRPQVYDPNIGSMVYLLEANEPVDGLEPFSPQKTKEIEPSVHNDRKEQQDQPMHGVEQTGLEDGADTDKQQDENSSVKNEDQQMGADAQPVTSPQQDENETANQSIIEKPGMTVYDKLIGGMVTILDPHASVDGMEEVLIKGMEPIVNYGDIPQTVQQNGRFAV
jgi:hypothetical protein